MNLIHRVKSLFESSDQPSAARRLDAKSTELLATAIKLLHDGERGWISLKDAAALFSSQNDEYPFRAMDRGMRNLASFVAEETYRCRFAFVEGQLYFIRDPNNMPEIRARSDGWTQLKRDFLEAMRAWAIRSWRGNWQRRSRLTSLD